MVRRLDDGDANEKAGTTTTTCTRVLRGVGMCRERRRHDRVRRQSLQRAKVILAKTDLHIFTENFQKVPDFFGCCMVIGWG